MNALTRTGMDLAAALDAACNARPTLADFTAWARPSWPGIGSSIASICPTAGMCEGQAEAFERIRYACAMEQLRHERRHWSANMNRLIALKQLVQKIEEYELENSNA